MKHTEVKGKLERIIQAETDKSGKRIGVYLEVLDENEKLHCCAFDHKVPAEYVGFQVWYQQWKSGWFTQKVRQELVVYTDGGQKITALQYPEEKIRKNKTILYAEPKRL